MKHEDERGVIEDLVVGENSAVTKITFTKGSVRGNHYHKKTHQIDLIVSGRLLAKTDMEEKEVATGDIIRHAPLTKHAYKALEDSVMVTMCAGPRKGEDYADDTFKLETPLL